MARRAASTDPDLDAGIATALDIFADLGPLRSRKMFGGAGIYAEGRMFALIADGAIFLKADAVDAARFDEAGCTPFIFEPKDGKPIAMSYRRMPDTALDDADEALMWGRLAVAAAARAAGKRA